MSGNTASQARYFYGIFKEKYDKIIRVYEIPRAWLNLIKIKLRKNN